MTLSPKEEAKKLVEQFMDIICPDGGALSYKQQQWERAKKCALIAVDEICEAINWHEFEVPNEQWNYWNKVKTEIEKV